jgi:hypothetical protein
VITEKRRKKRITTRRMAITEKRRKNTMICLLQEIHLSKI